jgi:hypothetical protein
LRVVSEPVNPCFDHPRLAEILGTSRNAKGFLRSGDG